MVTELRPFDPAVIDSLSSKHEPDAADPLTASVFQFARLIASDAPVQEDVNVDDWAVRMQEHPPLIRVSPLTFRASRAAGGTGSALVEVLYEHAIRRVGQAPMSDGPRAPILARAQAARAACDRGVADVRATILEARLTASDTRRLIRDLRNDREEFARAILGLQARIAGLIAAARKV